MAGAATHCPLWYSAASVGSSAALMRPVMEDADPAATSPTDEQLITRMQNGQDGSAFEILFTRHKQAFIGYLYRLSGSVTVAEDVSQHVWLKVIETIRSRSYRFDTDASFRTYLFTLGRNRYIDEYTRKFDNARGTDLDAASEIPASDATPLADYARSEDAVRVRQALGTLPLEQREVIALWAEGASIAHMVAITGAGRETVLSRKKYALDKLRRLFSKRDTGDAVGE